MCIRDSINVEVCTTVKSVKYIYKYVYKGYDSEMCIRDRYNNAILVNCININIPQNVLLPVVSIK